MVLLRKCYSQYFKRVQVSCEICVVLEMAEKLVSEDKPIMCVCCYTPPRDSPAYTQTTAGKGILNIVLIRIIIIITVFVWR